MIFGLRKQHPEKMKNKKQMNIELNNLVPTYLFYVEIHSLQHSRNVSFRW